MNYPTLASVPRPVLEASITGVLDICTPGRVWSPAAGDDETGPLPTPTLASRILLHGRGSEHVTVEVPVAHLPGLADAVLGPVDGPRADLVDLIGELANTVAGNLKALIGSDFSTGIPEAVPSPAGASRRLRFAAGPVALEVIFDA